MKRFFAILLSAMVLPAMLLTGCSEKGEAAEETAKISETIVGKWTETRLYTYEFDDNGKVTIDTFHNLVTGEYTYEDNVLEMKFMIDDIYRANYVFSVTASGDDVNLSLIKSAGPSGGFIPFEPGGLITGSMTALTGLEELTLTAYDKEPVFADIDDLEGAWIKIDYQYNYYDDVFYLFSDNSVTEFNEKAESREINVENGVEIYPDEMNYPDDYVKLYLIYKKKLYISDNYGNCVPDILEKYEETTIIDAEQLDGEYRICSGENALLKLEDGIGTLNYEEYSVPVEIIINGRTLSIASEYYTETFEYYLLGDKIYIINDENSAVINKIEWIY